MTDNTQFNSYDEAIKKIENSAYLDITDFNKIKFMICAETSLVYVVSSSCPSTDEIVYLIQCSLPKARYGFSYFPDGIDVKEKGKPDKRFYYYAWVRQLIDKNRFVDWTVGHINVGCALMIALLKTLRDLEKYNDL